MNDDRKLFKWAVVLVPIVASALAIYPPERKLKAGIDLAGGSSLLFEIDTSGLQSSEQAGLAERVMTVLKKRIDPNGQLNLVWRPIGNNRLEIQMPRPPKAALERRKAWEAARDQLRALNVTRIDIENLVHLGAEDQEKSIARLVSAVPERKALIDDLLEKYQAYQSASDKVGDARVAYEQAMERLLATSLNMSRFTDILALSNQAERETELDKIRRKHSSPAYLAAIKAAQEAYDEWAKDKGVLEDPSDLKRRIRGAGVLEFRILAERDLSSPTQTKHDNPAYREPIAKYVKQLQERGPRRRGGDVYQWFEVGDVLAFSGQPSLDALEKNKNNLVVILEKYAGKWYVLGHADRQFGLLKGGGQKWRLVNASSGVDSRTGGPAVNFTLDPRGGRLFAELTGNNINRPLAIFLDSVAQSWANIQSMIRQSGQIHGRSFTNEKVAELVSTLRAGSLPARLIETPLMENTVGPSLGEYNRKQGMRAAMLGGIAVVVFMLIYYQFAGVVANMALAMNLLIVLGIMATIEATFTLPGIAGLILTVGMAVDANVLIFERIREELDRGIGLRKAIRTGYDRAFSTIVDANITTLITCVILGYVGTEEVKGFAMVLGFGIVASMYTALFVTRVIFDSMLSRKWLKSLRMLRIIGRPSIDWLSLRRMFWPVSAVLVVLALTVTVLVGTTNKQALFDIEFLGGTSVQIELKKGEKVTDEAIRKLVTSRTGQPQSCVQWLESAADKLAAGRITRAERATAVRIEANGLSPEQLEAMVRPVFESKAERGGFSHVGSALVIDARTDDSGALLLDPEIARAGVEEAVAMVRKAASNLASARIQTVQSLDAAEDSPMAFELITVETNKELVKQAILAVMNDEVAARDPNVPRLNVERSVEFSLLIDPELAPEGYWPIQAEDDYLSDVLGEAGGTFDIRAFKGGVVLVFDELHPPMTAEQFDRRVREIRLQPQFSEFEVRSFRSFGLKAAGKDDGATTFSRIAYVASDPQLLYYDDPTGMWEERVAKLELEQVREALATEKSLRRVNQFAAQVATQTAQQAAIAVILSLAAIVAYIWIRFGQMQFGLAAIIALVHDVAITLGLVTVTHYIYASVIGRGLLLSDFKIDLPMIAAFLTIIGYSLNDTIVVFDRIRENRGKLKGLNPSMINASINQCLSRTLLTSLTTFLAVLVLYVFGGPGIHGFSFALLAGTVVGTYSSVGVAAPLLYRPRVLNVVVFVLMALGMFGLFALIVEQAESRGILMAGAAVVIGVALIWAIIGQLRGSTGARPATA